MLLHVVKIQTDTELDVSHHDESQPLYFYEEIAEHTEGMLEELIELV